MSWDKEKQVLLDDLLQQKKLAIEKAATALEEELNCHIPNRDGSFNYQQLLDNLADNWDQIVPLMEEYRKVRK